jgi:hypothetical protein
MRHRYDAKFGAMTKSRQHHSGSAGSGDPAVQYGYSLTGTTSVEFRADSFTYPTAREMWDSRGWRL